MSEEKVTEEMLDAYASRLADRLDRLLIWLPKDHPDYFASEGILPKRDKEPIYAKDRPHWEDWEEDEDRDV